MRYMLPLCLAALAACDPSPAPGDADALDAATAGDASETTADGGHDAALAAPCGEVPGAPAWVERAGHRLLARASSRRVEVTALAGGVTRLRYLPLDADVPDRSFALVTPASELAPAARVEVGADDGGETLVVCTDRATARVAREGGRVVLADAEGRVLIEDVLDPDARADAVRRATPAGEPFYGLGEKTGGLDRRGRRWVFWNTDAYDPALGGYRPDQDPLYASIPFFVALREGIAYGVFTDVAYRLAIDLAAARPDEYRVASDGPIVDQYVFAGPRMQDVLREYTALTGRAPIPPRWALGFHQCRWGYSPAARLEEVGAELRRRDIPADVLWLDIQHMDGFRSFTFDPVAFPDPERLAAGLAGDGFRLVVIEDPGLKVEPGWGVYDRARAGGHLLADAAGRPFEGVAWPGVSSFPDFTAPGARAFWADEIAALGRRGVDGVWLDVNEPTVFPESGGEAEIPSELPVAGDGVPTTMAEARNVYALHQARATFDGLRAAHPGRRPFVLTRAGYAGIQRYAAMWTGDAPSTWDSLRQVPAMLMGLGISGMPFVGSDIGGYSGHASAELFARWMAVGALSPFARAHVTNGVPGQEPWAFGQEVEDISRHRLRERYRMLPYLYALFAEANATGAPVLRPLVWEHPDEQALWRVDDQVMLGPFLMAAPILEPGATSRSVRLPAGRWYELDSGAIVEGPATITVGATLAAVPLFAREGAILPRGGYAAHTGAIDPSELRLDVYPGPRPTALTLYEDAGEGDGPSARTPITLERTASGARLALGAREGAYAPPARTLDVWVHRVDGEVSAVRVNGVALAARSDAAALARDGGYFRDPAARALRVRIPDAAPLVIELDYDAAITELTPPVEVTFTVLAPPGTPTDRALAIVTSADGWTVHHPLAWVAEGRAQGTVALPRGEWFEYKITRGDWLTVEKWADCAEAENRYGFAAAHPARLDTVAAWRDRCE
ncbi:MAG: DUF5110 domain-containing protein [Sandaracinaceae bacterium]|nr:DUF5110 domain-containing protein [Sandaracinaceae bacterium]